MKYHVEVKESARYGRVLVTTKSFNAGDVILREDVPLLKSYKGDLTPGELTEMESYKRSLPAEDRLIIESNVRFLRAFCMAPESVRAEVLDCFTPPEVEYKKTRVFKANVVVIPLVQRFAWSKGFDVPLLEKVLVIRFVNGHGDDNNALSGTSIYRLMSKLRHSCESNVTLIDGQLVALKNLRKGEEALFSYVNAFHSTPFRKYLLRECYFFDCTCDKCTKGVDRYRGMVCAACGKGTMWYNNDTQIWTGECCKKTMCIGMIVGESDAENQSRYPGLSIETCLKKVQHLKPDFGENHASVKFFELVILKNLIDITFDSLNRMNNLIGEMEAIGKTVNEKVIERIRPEPNLVEQVKILALNLLKWAGSLDFVGEMEFMRAAAVLMSAGFYDEALIICKALRDSVTLKVRNKTLLEDVINGIATCESIGKK